MRTRQIKPGFFKDDDLARLNPYVRILFAGLWGLADREGRLKDLPRLIGSEIFPYELDRRCKSSVDKSLFIAANSDLPPDELLKKLKGWRKQAIFGVIDVQKWLDQLQKTGDIKRYSVHGKCYIQIINFKQHQSPHMKEAQSVIPPPRKRKSTGQSTGLGTGSSTVPKTPKYSTIPSTSTSSRQPALDLQKNVKKTKEFTREELLVIKRDFVQAGDASESDKLHRDMFFDNFVPVFLRQRDVEEFKDHYVPDGSATIFLDVFYREVFDLALTDLSDMFMIDDDDFARRPNFETWHRRIGEFKGKLKGG